MKWYEIHDNFVLLCRYLVDVKDVNRDVLLQVIARPWRWDKEFNEARRWAATRDCVLKS